MKNRKSPIPSWYFDITKLLSYWQKTEGKRAYHHTAPISSCYAVHEALRLVLEEGIDNIQNRYQKMGALFQKELLARGFTYAVKDEHNRLPNLHCVYPPSNLSESKLRAELLKQNVEVGAGLGSLVGKVIRCGLMGANCNEETIAKFLLCLDHAIQNSQI